MRQRTQSCMKTCWNEGALVVWIWTTGTFWLPLMTCEYHLTLSPTLWDRLKKYGLQGSYSSSGNHMGTKQTSIQNTQMLMFLYCSTYCELRYTTYQLSLCQSDLLTSNQRWRYPPMSHWHTASHSPPLFQCTPLAWVYEGCYRNVGQWVDAEPTMHWTVLLTCC